MSSMEQHQDFNTVFYDADICRKISIAVKKSKILAHVKPINLLKEKLGISNVDENIYQPMPPQKKLKTQNPRHLGSPLKLIGSNASNANVTLLPTPDEIFIPQIESLKILPEKSKSPLNSSCGLLPCPESLFDDFSNIDPPIIASDSEFTISRKHDLNPFQEEYIREKNIVIEKFSEIPKNKNKDMTSVLLPEKTAIADKGKEKQSRNLFNLATFLLPLPSQLYDKQSMIIALENGNFSGFIELFKEGILIEEQVSSLDLCDILNAIIKFNGLSVMPDLCACLEDVSYYSQALSDSFVKYHNEMKDCQENVLNCLLTMIEADINSTMISFIEACFCVNDWNKMWSGVLTKEPTYKFDDKYFNACMSVFQNLTNNLVLINHDTMLIIISYIMRNYYADHEMYMADIWLYCVLTTDLNSETDLKVPQQILDKVIEKLIAMKNPQFSFIMKLISKNWSLMYNQTFCNWLSHLMSEKNDVKQCLMALKESMEFTNQNDNELNNSFLLLTLNVMSLLNKKSLFTSSKCAYDTFLHIKSDSLKSLLSTHADKFKYKWIIVECLISSTDYSSALDALRDFEVLKDLETSCVEYNRVKEMLPNLVWHLLNVQNMIPVIDLFEQVVSIFIFNESIDSSYTKNCNGIFDLIVIKAFESKDKEVVKKMICLLDHILSADIEFNISKEGLRYLLVASVRTQVPFNELLDFIDVCFKYEVFDTIQTAEDGFGSFVNVHSNLSAEEVAILITWMCRHVKIRLVDLAQSEGASVRENLMKVCSLRFLLNPSKKFDDFVRKLGANGGDSDLLAKFTEALNTPKYLSHPIKFTTDSDSRDGVRITCDNRVVYNAIYYSDI